MKYCFTNLKNSEIAFLIDEYIHSVMKREIAKLKFIDGYTYEKIAEIKDMSPRYIMNVIKECFAIISGEINCHK